MESSRSLSINITLAEELIREILSRACVTSLFRCRSVCKLWLSIISEPEFVEAHINAQQNKPSILVISVRIDRLVATIVYPNSPEYSVNLPLMAPFDNLTFVSSCYGLVCVSESFHYHKDRIGDIYLFNPLTMMYKKLPPAIEYAQQCLLFCGCDVVFGFDSLSGDFKVLKIAYERISAELVKLLVVQLYSFNSDLWKEIEVDIELPSLLFYSACPILISGPVIDGILFLDAVNTIIAFHLHDELFGLIPYPSFMHTRKSDVLDYEGSVAVVLETVVEGSLDKKEVGLWTVDSVSDEIFWKKILTFDAGSEAIEWVFVYCGADKFVGNTRSGTVLYDYMKKDTKHIRLPSKTFPVKVLKHTQSF